MSFLRTAQSLKTKCGQRGIDILRQSFSLNSVLMDKFKDGEDPHPRMRKRMNDIINDETYYTKRSRKDIGNLDNERIENVVHAANTCIKQSNNVPQFKECIHKAEKKVHEIESPQLRQRLQDTLDKSRNVRPRE